MVVASSLAPTTWNKKMLMLSLIIFTMIVAGATVLVSIYNLNSHHEHSSFVDAASSLIIRNNHQTLKDVNHNHRNKTRRIQISNVVNNTANATIHSNKNNSSVTGGGTKAKATTTTTTTTNNNVTDTSTAASNKTNTTTTTTSSGGDANSNSNNAIAMNNFYEFVAFISWYLFLIFCCIIPAMFVYRQRLHRERRAVAELHLETARIRQLQVLEQFGQESGSGIVINVDGSFRGMEGCGSLMHIGTDLWKLERKAILQKAWQKTSLELKNENLQLSCANNENEDVNANAMNYTHGRLDVDALDQGLRAQPVVAFSNGISSDRLLRNVEVEQEQHRLQRGDRDLVATIDGNMENRVDRLKERPANRAETSEGANDERLHLSIIEQSAEDQNNESELFNDSNGDAKVSLSTCQSTTNNESYVATTSLEANYGDVDVIDLPESNPVTGESYCNGGPRQIPNSCAICLSSYDIGRTLVWSANVSCPHAFHEDCITTWCIRKMEENPQASTCLCPCCRQSFVAVDL